MGNCQKEDSEVENPQFRNGPISELKVTNYVWQKAYQGLFDYQTDKMLEKTIKVFETSVLTKQKNQLSTVNEKDILKDSEVLKTSLFRMTKYSNYFKISPIYIEVEQYTLQKLLWLIVRTLPKQKYEITERDIIKFGKEKVKVKEIILATANESAFIDFSEVKVEKEIYEDLKFRSTNMANISMKKDLVTGKQLAIQNQVQSIVTANQTICRICLEPGLTTDPLIAPCKCTGSVKFIHLKCLRAWLSKRLNLSKQKNCTTLNWQKLTCEMCKEPFRYRIYLDNKKFYTVQIPKPDKPYIVLEVMKKSNDKSNNKIYHFVSLADKKKLSIGRKKDVDVRISDDISVSRHHASISYDQSRNKFILQDNRSKFGTLVLIKNNLLIKPKMRGIGFQIGTEVYRFESLRGVSQQRHPDWVEDDQDEFLNVQDPDQESFDQNDEDEDSEDDQDGYEDEENGGNVNGSGEGDLQEQRSIVQASSPDLINRNVGSLNGGVSPTIVNASNHTNSENRVMRANSLIVEQNRNEDQMVESVHLEQERNG